MKLIFKEYHSIRRERKCTKLDCTEMNSANTEFAAEIQQPKAKSKAELKKEARSETKRLEEERVKKLEKEVRAKIYCTSIEKSDSLN